MKYNKNKTLIENALAKAEYYEKEGNKELAEKFYKLAERIEEVNKKCKENELNAKNKGINYEKK